MGFSELDLSDEQIIRIIMEQTNSTEEEARFILAVERGEIDGDVVENANA